MYATLIPAINMAEMILIVFWGIYAIKCVHRELTVSGKDANIFIIDFVGYMICSHLLTGIRCGIDVEALIRAFRFSFYYVSAVVLGTKWIDWGLLKKTLKIVSFIAVAFLVLQYIWFYGFGIVLRGTIPGIPLYLSDYDALNYDMLYAVFFRPTSFFWEPAHFSQYVFTSLAICLMVDRKIMLAGALTVALVLSTSAQGIIIGGLLWVFWFCASCINRNPHKKQVIAFILFTAIISLAAFKLVNTEVFARSINRVLQTGEQGATHARLGVYSELFAHMDWLSSIFGKGFGRIIEGEWMPGLAYVFYGSGFIGVVMITGYLHRAWRRGIKFNRSMIMVFFSRLSSPAFL